MAEPEQPEPESLPSGPEALDTSAATVSTIDMEVSTEYGSGGADPYSNLDGAFGNYIADEPRPMQDVQQSGMEDDLLF